MSSKAEIEAQIAALQARLLSILPTIQPLHRQNWFDGILPWLEQFSIFNMNEIFLQMH